MTKTEKILSEYKGIMTPTEIQQAMQTCATEFAEWVSKHTRIRLNDGIKYRYDRTLKSDATLYTIEQLFKIWEEQ